MQDRLWVPALLVDISRYMNRILEVNKEARWVRVEPGVVLDELNLHLQPTAFSSDLKLQPRTDAIWEVWSVITHAAHIPLYMGQQGITRLNLKTILGDGSEVTFGPVDKTVFDEKCNQDNLEGKIYRNIREILDNPENRKSINENYPDPRIPRRNTGYALDLLLDSEIFR